MTIKDCIENAIKAGAIGKGQADGVLDLFDDLHAENKASMGASAAELKATQDAIEQIKIDKYEMRRQKLLAADTQVRLNELVDGYKNHKGVADPAEAVKAIFDATGIKIANISLNARYHALRGRAHAMVNELLEQQRRTLLGNRRDKAGLVDIVREAFGENSGNLNAKDMAGAWHDTADWLRTKYNAAGGHIGKLEGWGLPQSHDQIKVRMADKDPWIDFTLNLLDANRMIDGRTGKAFRPKALREVLGQVFETIRTGGLDGSAPNAGRGKSMANRHADHRFLQFKDADSWLVYQEKFGQADAFDAMMNHIDGMTRDIAAMETLGPNPAHMVEWLGAKLEADNAARKTGGKEYAGLLSKTKRAKYAMNGMFDAYMGTNNEAVGSGLAKQMQNVRGLLVAAQLGRAVFSAMTDTSFSAITARFNGLNYGGMFKQHMALLNPNNVADRAIAIRSGLIADEMSQVAASSARYTGEIAGNETVKRISDFVLRTTGLAPWTQAGKWAFGMEFLGHLADDTKLAFGKLDPRMQETLQRYGIEADDWDVIRQTELFEHEGSVFLNAENVAKRTDIDAKYADDLATKILAMVQTETDFAIPSTTLKAAGILPMQKAGTILGEVERSVMMYKSFPISMAYTHIGRILRQDGVKGKAAYAAQLVILTTMMGGLAVQLKDISKGRDPRAVDNADFWMQALAQGGGFGIYGDFLLSDTSRYGQSITTTLAGPVFGLAADVHAIYSQGVLDGDVSKVPAEVVKFLGKYNPGSSAWYSSVAFKRLLIDQLEMMADPKAKKKFARRAQKAMNENGGTMWWPEGDALPDHAPDLTNVMEN